MSNISSPTLDIRCRRRRRNQAGPEGEREGEGAQRDRASREGGQKEVAARFQIQKRQRFDEDFMEAVTKPVPQSEGGHCV